MPGILATPRPCGARGVVLATAEACRGRGGDWEGNDVLLRRRLDGGQTWEPPQVVVAREEYGPGPVSNFVMIAGASADTGGTIHALYCHNKELYVQADVKHTIRNLILFTVLVNALAWGGSLLGGDPSKPGLGFLIWGTAPLVSCLGLRAVTRDWGDLGIRPNLAGNVLWYLISILAHPVALAITLGLGVAQNVVTFQGFTWPAFMQAFLPALVIYFAFAIFWVVLPSPLSMARSAFAPNPCGRQC